MQHWRVELMLMITACLGTFPTNTVYPGMQRTWGVEVRYDF